MNKAKSVLCHFARWIIVLSFLLPTNLIPFSFAGDGPRASSSSEITSEAFVSSDAGHFLQAGDYTKALAALNDLIEQYPNDPLLLRYQAMAYDRTGNSEQAISILEDLLLQSPSHIPTHYFLAQAYAHAGRQEDSVSELKWVAAQGEGTPYESWSYSALAGTKELKDRINVNQGTKSAFSNWHVFARYGYEYDSNVLLRPNDPSLKSTRDQNAGRQVLDLALRYRAYSQRDLSVDFHYAVRQTVHDDSLDEFNFHSEEFAVDMKKRLQIKGQDFIGGARYDVSVGFLGEHLYSVKNTWKFDLDTRFSAKTRTVFYDSISLANYAFDGSDGPRTSRDGVYNDFGATHYLFSDDFKDYLYLTQEFNSSHTSGENFDTIGTTTRVGMRKSLHDRLDLDASAGLKLRFFHSFNSLSTRDESRRRDQVWDYYTALTYHLSPNLGLRCFYRYIDGDNQNNFYDYSRQIGGVHLIYSRSL